MGRQSQSTERTSWRICGICRSVRKAGATEHPPVKRAYVPKNEKEDRPIGIPTTEDKILQRAVSMILEPIYEQEFLPFSFGFRPGRSQHDALEYLREQCFAQKVQWILEVDLRKVFRHCRSSADAGDSEPPGAGWSDQPPDRQMAEGGSDGKKGT